MNNTETRTHQFDTREMKKINTIQKLSFVIIALGVILCVIGVLLLARPSTQKVTMPEVVNRMAETVEMVLETQGVNVEIKYETRDGYADGEVIEQNPEAGELIELGTTVTLIVNKKESDEEKDSDDETDVVLDPHATPAPEEDESDDKDTGDTEKKGSKPAYSGDYSDGNTGGGNTPDTDAPDTNVTPDTNVVDNSDSPVVESTTT